MKRSGNWLAMLFATLAPVVWGGTAVSTTGTNQTLPSAGEKELQVVDRSALPAPGPLRPWSAPPVETWSLANGMQIWFLRQTSAPLVSVRWVSPFGSATDPRDKSGLTDFVFDMLDEGAGGRDALALDNALQRLATDLYADVRTDSSVVGMSALADTLEESLALFADVLQRPALARKDFKRRREQRLAEALSQEANPDYARRNVLRRALFGEYYGGFPDAGTRRGMEAIEFEDIGTHYGALVVPGESFLVVVGAVERPRLEAAIKAAFGDWSGEPSAKERPLPDDPPEHAIYLVDYPGAPQTSVSVARRSGGADAGNLFAARAFSWILAESFTSRINMNLREDKGYTYGAYGNFVRWPDMGFYTINSDVKTDKTLASVEEILRELKAVERDRPVTRDEHRNAVEGLRLGFPSGFEHMEQVAEQLVSIPRYDRPVNWLSTWTQKMAAVTEEDINRVARSIADPNDFVVVLVGDRKTLEPALVRLGWPIRYYSPQGNPLP